MKTLIMSSSLTVYEKDQNGNEYARIIDNDNGFLDNLRKHMTSRKCMVVIFLFLLHFLIYSSLSISLILILFRIPQQQQIKMLQKKKYMIAFIS